MRGCLVSESARSEMHAHPNPVLLVREKIDIMISASDGAELFRRHRFQIADRFNLPRRIIEQLMFYARFALAPDTKRNVVHPVVHALVDLWRDVRELGVGQNRKIAASDVESDAAQRDFIFVSNN